MSDSAIIDILKTAGVKPTIVRATAIIILLSAVAGIGAQFATHWVLFGATIEEHTKRLDKIETKAATVDQKLDDIRMSVQSSREDITWIKNTLGGPK